MKNNLIPSIVIALSALLLTCCNHRNTDSIPTVFIHKHSDGEYYAVDINGNKLSGIPFYSFYDWPTIGNNSFNSNGFIDTITGEMIIPKRFNSVIPVSNSDLFQVSINGLQGVIDKNRRIIVPIEFKDIQIIDYNSDSCFLCISDSIGKLIGFDGQTLQTYNHSGLSLIESSSQHFLSFTENDSIGIIDIAGNTILPAEYQDIVTYDTIWKLNKNNKYRLFSPTRLTAITPWFKSIYKNTNSTYTFCDDANNYGLIDISGKIILPANYKEITQVSNYYKVKDQNNNYGLMDSAFRIAIPIIYKAIFDFRNGLCIVKDNNYRCGVVDKDLNTVIPFKYEQISFENNNCFKTQKNSKYGIIDIDGKIILPFKYDKISTLDGYTSYYVISNKGLYGIADSKGNTILPCNYKNIYTFHDSPNLFETNDGVYDSTGKVIVPRSSDYSCQSEKGFIYISDKKHTLIYNLKGKKIAKTRKEKNEFYKGDAIYGGKVSFISIDSIGLCCITNRSGKKTLVYNTDGKRIIRCRHIYRIKRNGKEIYEIEKRNGKFGKLVADGNNIKIVWY